MRSLSISRTETCSVDPVRPSRACSQDVCYNTWLVVVRLFLGSRCVVPWWSLGLASLFDRSLPSDFNEFVKRTCIYIIQQELYLINPCRIFMKIFHEDLDALNTDIHLHMDFLFDMKSRCWTDGVHHLKPLCSLLCVSVTQLVTFWTDWLKLSHLTERDFNLFYMRMHRTSKYTTDRKIQQNAHTAIHQATNVMLAQIHW